MSEKPQPTPSRTLDKLEKYSFPKAAAPTDLALDANEGPSLPLDLLPDADTLLADINRYPDPPKLEAAFAEMLGILPSQVITTCGADEAIDRICRTYIPPGRELLVATPTFIMIPTFATVYGGPVVRVDWPKSGFPTDAMIEAVNENTGIISVITPNNPTGQVATAEQLHRISEAAAHALLMVDFAYRDFADTDLISAALELPNTLAMFTLSKAWGLAGLRVGFVAGNADLVSPLRACGAPFPVSSVAVKLATHWLAEGRDYTAAYVARVKEERALLADRFKAIGYSPWASQANFVFAEGRDVLWLRDAMAGMGIAVRLVPPDDLFEGGIRITCPGNEPDYQRLDHALLTVKKPEAILFDMDGVLADVSRSYREAIRLTCASYGIEISDADIATAKAGENANNDWIVCQRLLGARGISAKLDKVTERFETLYQGTDDKPGLRERESLIPEKAFLEKLSSRLPLGIVTGRPRGDAERFIEKHRIGALFKAVVCMEDAERKPSPEPIEVAMKQLKVTRAWMIGDAPDDIRSARSAYVLPLGITAPGDSDSIGEALSKAGAARILTDLTQLEELLP